MIEKTPRYESLEIISFYLQRIVDVKVFRQSDVNEVIGLLRDFEIDLMSVDWGNKEKMMEFLSDRNRGQ